MTRLQVADLIESFVSGTCGIWEWDDFISVIQADVEIERVRLICTSLPDRFSPRDTKQYCSDEGVRELLKCAKTLRE